MRVALVKFVSVLGQVGLRANLVGRIHDSWVVVSRKVEVTGVSAEPCRKGGE